MNTIAHSPRHQALVITSEHDGNACRQLTVSNRHDEQVILVTQEISGEQGRVSIVQPLSVTDATAIRDLITIQLNRIEAAANLRVRETYR